MACSDKSTANQARDLLGAKADASVIAEWKRLALTNTVIHEFGHAIGITHHRGHSFATYRPEVPDSVWGPVDCAMRYSTNGRDTLRVREGGKRPFYTRYCRRQVVPPHDDRRDG